MTAIEEITRLLTSMDSIVPEDLDAAAVVLREALVISKTSFVDRGDYYNKLERIGFRPLKIYKSGNLMNVIAWQGGMKRLRGILESMRYELLRSEGTAAELPPPEKVTLAWLSRHLPWHMWLTFIGLLGAAFMAGLNVGANDFLTQLINLFTHHAAP